MMRAASVAAVGVVAGAAGAAGVAAAGAGEAAGVAAGVVAGAVVAGVAAGVVAAGAVAGADGTRPTQLATRSGGPTALDQGRLAVGLEPTQPAPLAPALDAAIAAAGRTLGSGADAARSRPLRMTVSK